MPPKKKQPVAKQTAHLPPREQVVNRANVKRVENGLPTVESLASTRSRRPGTDKMYFANKPPEAVPRRQPTQRTVVARLDGQDDIPSSPPNILVALRQAAREATTSAGQASTSNSEPQVETATSETVRTESTSAGPAGLDGRQHDNLFGAPNHPSFEPQYRPVTNISPEDAHLLDIPEPDSNPDFRDADNWNSFGNGDHDEFGGYNAGEGQFDYGVNGFNVDVGLNGVNYGGNGFGNWTHSGQALQSEFAMPQSSSFLNTHGTGFPSATSTSAPMNVSGSGQTTQTRPNNPSVLPNLPTSTLSVERPNDQLPPIANSLLGHPQYAVLPSLAPATNSLPANQPHYVPSYTRATSANPVASTSANDNHNYDPVSTPMRNATPALQTRLRRLNNSSKKISSKTPQRNLMKANVAAHYAVKRARQQRTRSRRQKSQDVELTEAEPQSGSTSAAAPVIASTSDGLTSNQLAVGLPMRKYIGFHILTRTAWPTDQPTLLASALAYARTVPGNSEVGDVEFDQEFLRHLKLKESSLRGEFINLIMQSVKDFHQVSPSTGTRIDSLIRDDCYVYQDETITPRSQPGFFGNRLVFEVIGAFLFQHAHVFGTLFIQELCSEDAPKKWHAKAADKSATNGAPVGLLAFAGVAILHCLECIRDRPPTGKKAYKFEHARYGHIWTRYRKELIKYKHLGALRRKCLEYIKRRYNEINRIRMGRGEDSDFDSDGDEDMSSDYASDDPMDGPQFEEAAEEDLNDSDEDI
ncbi:hypothetical protein FRC12_009106 [Ceratobasidium sp. 428]|nr:hypothetical protein FRC12_009106 [Ceratobasidium sp. 428]